jgi:hypothetical protein
MGKLYNEKYPFLNNYFSFSLEHNKCFSKDLVMSLFLGVMILTHFQVMKKYLKMWIKRLPCFSMCIFHYQLWGYYQCTWDGRRGAFDPWTWLLVFKMCSSQCKPHKHCLKVWSISFWCSMEFDELTFLVVFTIIIHVRFTSDPTLWSSKLSI